MLQSFVHYPTNKDLSTGKKFLVRICTWLLILALLLITWSGSYFISNSFVKSLPSNRELYNQLDQLERRVENLEAKVIDP